jgi:hypothetical protein
MAQESELVFSAAFSVASTEKLIELINFIQQSDIALKADNYTINPTIDVSNPKMSDNHE